MINSLNSLTQNPIYQPGSFVHVATNPNIDNKGGCIKEIAKDNIKDTVKLAGSAATVGGAAAIITGCSKKVQGALSLMKDSIKTFTDNVEVKIGNGIFNTVFEGENKSLNATLTDIIKNNKLFKSFNKLTTPAKAGIAAGALALLIGIPKMIMSASAKAGYKEGQFEKEQNSEAHHCGCVA